MNREKVFECLADLDDRFVEESRTYAPGKASGAPERILHMKKKRIITLALVAALLLSLSAAAYAIAGYFRTVTKEIRDGYPMVVYRFEGAEPENRMDISLNERPDWICNLFTPADLNGDGVIEEAYHGEFIPRDMNGDGTILDKIIKAPGDRNGDGMIDVASGMGLSEKDYWTFPVEGSDSLWIREGCFLSVVEGPASAIGYFQSAILYVQQWAREQIGVGWFDVRLIQINPGVDYMFGQDEELLKEEHWSEALLADYFFRKTDGMTPDTQILRVFNEAEGWIVQIIGQGEDQEPFQYMEQLVRAMEVLQSNAPYEGADPNELPGGVVIGAPVG